MQAAMAWLRGGEGGREGEEGRGGEEGETEGGGKN